MFVDPEYRDCGLSHLLAEAAADVTVAVLREFHVRLTAAQTQTCDVEVTVIGEPLSPGGERVLEAVAHQFAQQWHESIEEAERTHGLRVTTISVIHE
ncbi:hypothetical protein E2553_18920 [Paraburkholderia dipogonis]|uniref:Uncharacterized protein n=1 Tax=Paraburkholderia dipogonis TaxID=1211383 RepID=A0A4Y8NC63_9BURK|nr:hypothetical protein [Paraburkholderia dipogonis]TFE46928.1 hypothetical protein E2553_18920 [Paraburkholderia dipogonis]